MAQLRGAALRPLRGDPVLLLHRGRVQGRAAGGEATFEPVQIRGDEPLAAGTLTDIKVRNVCVLHLKGDPFRTNMYS